MLSIEKAYEEFTHRDDKIIKINGKIYYRIVCSDFFDITGRDKGCLAIVPSPDMPRKSGTCYQDENGNHFFLGGFSHIRFIGEIPEWYLKCGEWHMEWQETKDIGQYLSIVE